LGIVVGVVVEEVAEVRTRWAFVIGVGLVFLQASNMSQAPVPIKRTPTASMDQTFLDR
jgi:hypothetical protein